MKGNFYILIAMLLVCFTPLSMQAFGTSPATTNKTIVAGCEGVTVAGGSGSITVTGLGAYSHIQVFTPGFASQVFNQEISTSSITVPVGAGDYIVKVWSNPNPAAFCENNFPVTVGGVVDPCATDATAPTFTSCPTNINLTTTGTCAYASWTAPTATDNCGTPTVTQVLGSANGSCFPVGTTLVKYMATDAKGNTAICVFNVIVTKIVVDPCATDAVAPVFADCPANINLTTTGTCAYASWTAPTATDNCGTPTVTQVLGSANGSCFPVGTTLVKYMATDAKGNTAICVFNVIVTKIVVDPCATDAVAPVFADCPGDVNLTTTGSCAYASWTAPTATDNCGTPTVTQVLGSANGSCFPVGTTIVKYIATDAKGNTAICVFNIVVTKIVVDPCATDVTPPVIHCPGDMVKTPTNGGTCWTTFTWSSATATDNCSTPYVQQIGGPTSGSCIGYGVSTVTYKATDAKGNVATCSFTITVNRPADPCASDVTPPSISCPANMVKTPTNGGTCWTTFTWSSATATDNCSTPYVQRIGGPASGSCIGYGVSTVTYKATDAKGNASTCSFTVTINKPTTTCSNPTVQFKNSTTCALNVYWVNSYGQKTWYKTLNAGSWYNQPTYSGHRWLMCKSNGAIVHDYTANSSSCTQYATASNCNYSWWLATNDAITMEAKAEVNRVQIGFVNNTGQKNDYFTVEKLSQVTGDFEKLETVNNKSTSTDNEYYNTYDNNPSEGDNTYRVKVSYLDGTSSISGAQTVNFKGTSDIRTYPNPAVDVVGVDLSKYKGQAVTIALYNQFGQQVLTQQVEKASGTVSLDISQTPMGNYMMRVVSKGRKDALQQLHIAK